MGACTSASEAGGGTDVNVSRAMDSCTSPPRTRRTAVTTRPCTNAHAGAGGGIEWFESVNADGADWAPDSAAPARQSTPSPRPPPLAPPDTCRPASSDARAALAPVDKDWYKCVPPMPAAGQPGPPITGHASSPSGTASRGPQPPAPPAHRWIADTMWTAGRVCGNCEAPVSTRAARRGRCRHCGVRIASGNRGSGGRGGVRGGVELRSPGTTRQGLQAMRLRMRTRSDVCSPPSGSGDGVSVATDEDGASTFASPTSDVLHLSRTSASSGISEAAFAPAIHVHAGLDVAAAPHVGAGPLYAPSVTSLASFYVRGEWGGAVGSVSPGQHSGGQALRVASHSIDSWCDSPCGGDPDSATPSLRRRRVWAMGVGAAARQLNASLQRGSAASSEPSIPAADTQAAVG